MIEYTDKAKLLGVIFNNRMTTSDNTKNIETKSYKRMWIIKRLANLGCPQDDLLMTYVRQIRSICEFAAPFWGPMITLDESRRIERIQRTALHIILGPEFTCYSRALETTGMERLDYRREVLIKKFAIKTANNEKFAHWFIRSKEPVRNTRSEVKNWREVYTRTEKYKKSAIPHMTNILNNMEESELKGDELVCDQCNLSFSNRNNLKLHSRFKHKEDGNLPIWSNKTII